MFIHSVDAQSSANGGIIIQVIGEMSNRGEPWRKFAQTFFLAQQPNGYFVLNDIFRFLKEESVEDEEENGQPEAAPPPTVVAQENTVEPAAPGVQASHPTVAATPYDSILPNHLQQQSIPEPSEPAEVVVLEEQKPIIVNGYHPPAPEPTPVVAPIPQAEPIKQAPVVEPSQPSPVMEVQRPLSPQIAPRATPSPTPVAASPAVSAAAAQPLSTPTLSQPSTSTPVPPAPSTAAAAVASKPAPPVTQSPPAPKPAAPKTWANLAAANSNKWGTRVAQDAKGVSAAPPAPVTPPVAPSPSQSRNEHRGGDKEGVHPAYQAALNVSTPQCFVKSVNEVVSHQTLFNTLSARFGPVKDLEIIRSKACAFLEFATLDSARKAIIASLSPNAGGEGGFKIDLENGGHTRVIIETRKERSERQPPRIRPSSQGPGQQGQGQGQGQGQNQGGQPHGQERSGGGGGGHGNNNNNGGGGGGFRSGSTRGRGAGRGGKS